MKIIQIKLRTVAYLWEIKNWNSFVKNNNTEIIVTKLNVVMLGGGHKDVRYIIFILSIFEILHAY